MTLNTLLFAVLAAGLPVIWALYALSLRGLQSLAPAELQRIDPLGYRALNATSQLRFCRYLLARHYAGLDLGSLRGRLDLLRWSLIIYASLLAGIIALAFS